MKTFILMLALFSMQSFAVASECNGMDRYEVSKRAFTGTTFSSSYNGQCDLWAAEAHAINKCKRSGYTECRRLFGDRGVEVSDGGTGQVCTVTVQGIKFEGVRPECN